MLNYKRSTIVLSILVLLVGWTYAIASVEKVEAPHSVTLTVTGGEYMDLKVPEHVEGYVPLVGQEPQDPNEAAEIDKLNQQEQGLKTPRNMAKGQISSPIMVSSPYSYGNKTTYFSEDFESYAPSSPDDPYPVPGWTRITTVAGYTWFIATASSGGVPNGTQASLCPYGPYGSPQDEWMITPQIDVASAGTPLYVDFYYLHDNSSWPFELDLYISTTGTDVGDFSLLWQASVNGAGHPNMEYTLATVDLSTYAGGGGIYLAWRYQGEDANLGGVDDIVVYDDVEVDGRCCYGDPEAPSCSDEFQSVCEARADFISWTDGTDCTEPCPIPPVGRCCYGDPQTPSCADEIQIYCESRGDMISWTEGLDCTTPCPVPPENDEWTGAVALDGPYPQTVTGTTVAATSSCPGVLDWNEVWYKVDLGTGNFSVSLDYCGTDPALANVGIVYYEGTVVCADYIVADDYYWHACPVGDDNPFILLNSNITGPTTLYIPVMTDDAKAAQDFEITLDVIEIFPPENDDCANATAIGDVTDLAFSTSLATHDGPGLHYISGPNIWYCYTATCTGEVTVDLCGSDYDTKVVVYEDCTCIDFETRELAYDDDGCPSKTTRSLTTFMATSGLVYLIEVAGYSANAGDGLLTVYCTDMSEGACCFADGSCQAPTTEDYCLTTLGGDSWMAGATCDPNPCPQPGGPGDNCLDPYTMTLPAEMPWQTVDETTCGRGDDYNEDDMCYAEDMGFSGYGEDEDMVYEITVTAAIDFEIVMDPQGTGWTYVEIRTECGPPAGDCIMYFRSTNSVEYISDLVHLEPGTYYMLVDSWIGSSTVDDCIPSFTLTIQEVVPPDGRCCYGDPYAPSCEDVTEADCNAHGDMISWSEDKNCTDNPCMAASSGDDCTDPFVVKLPDDMVGGTYVNTNTNCDRGNNYNMTCLGSYDGGEDMIYELDVDGFISLDILLDPGPTTYTGIMISADCPDDDETCIDYSTSYSASEHGMYGVDLTTGLYYLMIDTYPSPDCIPEFTLTLTEHTAVDNDDYGECEAVGEVTDLPFSTTGATFDGPGGCMTSPNIWYCYTPSGTGSATISLCGSAYDTKLAVYDGTDPTSDPELGCNDDFDCPSKSVQSQLTVLVTSGNTYLIEVGGYSSNVGTGILNVSLCSPLPPNNNCEDVTPATLTLGTPVTFTGNNECATNQCEDFGGNHVWEAFTIPTGANVTLDYCGTTPAFGNAWLNLALGCPCSDFTAAAVWNVDDCGDGNVTMTWSSLLAGTYYYPVMSEPGSVGDYTIHVVANAIADLCDAAATSDDEYISRVLFGDIDNSTGWDGYGDYTSLSTTVEAGMTYPITVEIGSGYGSDNTALWVDWNQDNIFDPATEETYVGDGSGPFTVDVVVPAGAASGATTMRVRLTYSVAPVPCGNLTWGDVEDYTLNVMGGEPEFAYDPADIDFGTVEEGATGNTTLNLSNTGGGTINYGIVLDYGTKDISGATMSTTGSFEPGATNTYTLLMTNPSPDTEWLMAASLTTPTGVTVNTASYFIEQANSNHYLNWQEEVGDGITTTWYYDETYGIYDGQVAEATIELAFDAGLTADVTIDYVIDGDGWGGEPHQVVGSFDIPLYIDPTTNWLSISDNGGDLGGGETDPIIVSYDATDLPNGTYTANIVITTDIREVVTVPVTIEVFTPLTIDIEPDPLGSFHLQMIDADPAMVYLGGDFEIGYDVNDVDPATVTVNSLTPLSTPTVIPSYPGFVGEVLEMEVDLYDLVGGYGLLWDVTVQNYTVAGTFTDMNTFTEVGDVGFVGHRLGEVNGDQIVNLMDILYLIENIYLAGPDPVGGIEVGDCDCSSSLNLADILFLINYLYMEGPTPDCIY